MKLPRRRFLHLVATACSKPPQGRARWTGSRAATTSAKGSGSVCHLKIAAVEVSVAHQNTSCWHECCDQRDTTGMRPELSGLAFLPIAARPSQSR
jgi:hypothetical protein